MNNNATINIGLIYSLNDADGKIQNGMVVRKAEGKIFFVNVTNGEEVKLNVTEILKSMGWFPRSAV